jgi:hypothetical protein
MIKAIVGKAGSGKSTKLLEENFDLLFDIEGSKKLQERGAVQIPFDSRDFLSFTFRQITEVLSTPKKYVVGLDAIDLFRHPLKTIFKRIRKFQSAQNHHGFEVDFIVTYQMSRKGYIFAEGVDIIEVIEAK